MTAEVNSEGLKNDALQTNLTDGKDELFCGLQKHDSTKDSDPTENRQDDMASQSSMDCGSAGGLEESDPAGSRSNAAQTHCSNGQKSKRPSSPGPHPVKTTCVDAHSSNPKLTLFLSPRKGVSTPSDVEMLSPDSPICKTMLINDSADKDHDGSACAEDSGFAKGQVVASQQFVNNSDSGSSAKEKSHLVTMGTEYAEVAECSGSSNMSQDLIRSQPGAIFERYMFTSLHHFLSFTISESPFLLFPTSTILTVSFSNSVLY